jgi:hypothetical protein
MLRGDLRVIGDIAFRLRDDNIGERGRQRRETGRPGSWI